MRLWTCGFELQSVTAGVEVLSVTGTPTISTSVRRSGAASLRINPTAATQYAEQQIDSGTVKRTLHRFYLRITTLPSADCNIYGIGQSGYFPGLLRLKTNGTLTLRDGFTSADIGTASAALSTGVWYRIELDYSDTAGTAGSVTGAFKGYLDGAEFSSTVCSNINGWSRVRIGAQTAVTGEFHIDDVAVNDTSGSAQTGLPGPGNVVHLKPNAAGDNNLFGTAVGGTAGAANNFTRVNETTPNDATSYNETAATGTTTIDDVNLDSSATAGIGTGERVTLVQVGARIGSNAATAASLVYRIKSQAAGTVLESASVSVALNGWASQKSAAPYVYQLTSYTDPQAGGAWTQALLDTAQIGYRTNVSQATTRRVSALWALVETVPITTQALTLASETSTAQALGRRKTLTLGVATETSAAQALAPLAGTPFSALADTFGDGVVDPAKWPDSYDPGGFSETGGRARVACTTAYNAYASSEAYRLRESHVHVRMWPPAAGGATAEAWAQLLVQTVTLGTDAIFEVSAVSGNLIMAVRTGYFDPGQTAITYDPVAHAWLRIRETGGQLYWDTSPDGATWTNRRTATSPAWVSDTTLQVQLIAHRDGGTNDYAEFGSFNSPAGQSAALGTAVEADTARALAGSKATALGRAAEADAAQALAGRKTGLLGTAGESGSAQAFAGRKARLLGTATEADAAQALAGRKSLALGTAVEADTAQALGRSRSRALTPAGETAAAQAVGRIKTAALTAAAEADEARALTGSRAAALGPAVEAGAARPFGRAKTGSLGPASTVETAQLLVGRKARLLGTAAESSVARPVSTSKSAVLPVAEETTTALPLAPASGLVAAEETSTARALGRVKTRAMGVAGEVGEARPLGRAKAVGLTVAAETATARPLTGSRSLALVPAEETSTARPLSWSRARQLPTAVETSEALGLTPVSAGALGAADETDSARPVTGRKTQALTAAVAVEAALPVTGRKTAALGVAVEIGTARPLAGGKRADLVPAAEVSEAQRLLVPGALATAEESSTALPLVGRKTLALGTAVDAAEAQQLGTQSLIALGRADEVASALPMGRRKTRALPTAAGLEAAQPLRGTKACALGRAAEVTRALIGPQIRLTPAVEHSQALTLTGHRQQPADRLDPSTSGPVLTPSTSGPGLSTSSSGPHLAASSTGGG
ncbi:hypothetical protein [Streptomyces sp. NPDC055210]